MLEMTKEQFTAGGGIWNYAFAAPLGTLGADPECAPRRVDIVGAKTAQLLAPQSCIVCEGQHDAVADRLLSSRGKNAVPVVFVRNPGQLVVSGNHRSVPLCRWVVRAPPSSIKYAWNNRTTVNSCWIVAFERREPPACKLER